MILESLINKKLKNIILATIAVLVFWTSYASAGLLLSNEEIYGQSKMSNGNGNIAGGVVFILIIILLHVWFNNIGRKDGADIVRENAQNFNKLIEKLSNDTKTQDLVERIRDCEYTNLFLESNEHHIFFSFNTAKEKEREINEKSESIALIVESQSKSSGMWIENYTVFGFKK